MRALSQFASVWMAGWAAWAGCWCLTVFNPAPAYAEPKDVYSVRTRFLIAQLYEENALVVYDAENEIERLGAVTIPDLIDCVCSCAGQGDAADVVKGRCDHLLFRVTKFQVPFLDSEHYPTSSCDTWSKWWDRVGARHRTAGRVKLIRRPADPRRMDLLVRLCVLSRKSAEDYANGELATYDRKALIPYLIEQLKDPAVWSCRDGFLEDAWKHAPVLGVVEPNKAIRQWKHWWRTKGRRKAPRFSEAKELEWFKQDWDEGKFCCGEAQQGAGVPGGSSDGTSGTEAPARTPTGRGDD